MTCWKFQSTPPVWGATFFHFPVRCGRVISIHAPRVGGDWICARTPIRGSGFQSTPPVWGATIKMCYEAGTVPFQSTPPVWGATLQESGCTKSGAFQSTPPVWGATCHMPLSAQPFCLFQSTPPVWGATGTSYFEFMRGGFQSTPPVWGATRVLSLRGLFCDISIHAPRVGGDSESR